MESSLRLGRGVGEYLEELRFKSLKLICNSVALVAYVWGVYVVWPQTGGALGSAGWTSSISLILGLVVCYYTMRRSTTLASLGLIAGLLVSIAGVVVAFQKPDLVYLFVIPVAITGVLLGPIATTLVAGVGVALTTMVDVLLQADVLRFVLPHTILLLTALVSMIAETNLYTALRWSWESYNRSLDNELKARLQRAELRQALKALDEGTYRLERMNHMLALAKEQADEARRLKQSFAQTISHELRTPLNLIVGFTELMTQSPEYYGQPLPGTYARDLSIVHRNARHLQDLVNDVLDLSRIEAAQMSLVLSDVDPATLVQEAVRTARSLVESKGLQLLVEIEKGLPTLHCDPTRIRQVLFNLMNNAVRFTESGSVTVGVKSDGANVHFWVQDTGVGISRDDLPKLFEEFQQLDSGTNRSHGGAGLGLAISRGFVLLHGGSIWAESELGHGSTFRFSLPVSESGVIEGSMAFSQIGGSRPSPRGGEHILLLVTHSPSAIGLLTRYIHGIRIVAVRDLAQLRDVARDLVPQAVLVDTSSVVWNGQRGALFGGDMRMSDVPVIACPLPGEEPLRRNMDVQGYLTKPISQDALWDALREFGDKVNKVLIVDDDRDFVRLVGRILENPVRQYESVGAYTGAEAFSTLTRWLPDLVILDLGLPDMDGAELLAKIRAHPHGRALPIIVVTGHGETEGFAAMLGDITVSKESGLTLREILAFVQTVVDTGISRTVVDRPARGADSLAQQSERVP
ncbi:MAG: response regulator [Chloroflexi bacterium]|jgi:signal transduction histidine kinase/CheY-like chemotaxis protein|nr:response regulator [Chloroflexota bacterium]